ncbi:glycerate kinase [Enterococcus asini]|uniref:glycerate kinase family protein n=1 Tax=Enterococcus asini TaxID=57732 RepID=UPI00288EDBC5|nr:glycerate kinase [Enterococcus asini]MDT2756323.1 glycerate kinase [Enterococcus asini]
MKLLAAIDSFKGSATSKELNEALLAAVDHPMITEKISIPIADGGEGTLQAIQEALGGELLSAKVPDLTGALIEAPYLITDFEGQKTGIIESAMIIGIDRITPSKETICKTTSLGLGILVAQLVNQGIEKIIITLGGSGTSDGGLGFLAGMGAFGITKEQQNPLFSTNAIQLEAALAKLANVELIALADVTNPYVGDQGFSMIFGPQKGGTPDLLKEMDRLAVSIAKDLSRYTSSEIATTSGAGAAGGLGGAILALGGKIQPGFATISQLIGLEEQIAQADLIITGEGSLDGQTEKGKVPFGVAQLAKKHGKPVFALCGKRSVEIGAMASLVSGAYAIQLGPVSLSEAMNRENTLQNIGITGSELVNLFLEGVSYHD